LGHILEKKQIEKRKKQELNNIDEKLTSKLDEKQMKVVNMLFGLDCEQLELKEVAEKMKMSKESVRTIKIKAIEIMKQ
jgi:DNA-directed RNA polymerase sigma subunit (sigma70/sigma32)